MQVYLHHLGCRLNEAELQGWARSLQTQGHCVVRAPEDADVMVLNTCAVTVDAGRSSRKLARSLNRRNPRGKLVVTGCYSELEPSALDADLIIPNAEKDEIVAQLDLLEPGMPRRASEAEVFPAQRTRAFVKVQDGCNNRCTFCIVTVARGDERSRSIQDVVAEVQHLHELGHQEVVLTGVHLGGWGSDLGQRLPELIDAVLTQTQVPRIRMGSLEPWDLEPPFFSLFANPRLCPHLHLPLQSGSDRVLRRMARRVTVEGFTQLVQQAREVPDMQITTDLIVGFPGETEADFAQTLQTVERLRFADLHVFRYSSRPGTAAARMSPAVPGPVRATRSRELHAVSSRIRTEILEQEHERLRDVLFEAADADGRHQGYTANFLRVVTEGPPPAEVRNQLLAVRLRFDGERLLATPVASGDRARV